MAPKRRFRKTDMDSMCGHMVYGQMVPQDHFIRALKELFDW